MHLIRKSDTTSMTSVRWVAKMGWWLWRGVSILQEERQIGRQVSHGAFLGVVLGVDEVAIVGDAGVIFRAKGVHRRVCLVGRGLNFDGHNLSAAGQEEVYLVVVFLLSVGQAW